MIRTILVIHEIDHDDEIHTIVGVASSVEEADKMIKEYYGKHEELSRTYIVEGNVEYKKILEVENANHLPNYKVSVWLEWFTINEL